MGVLILFHHSLLTFYLSEGMDHHHDYLNFVLFHLSYGYHSDLNYRHFIPHKILYLWVSKILGC